MRARRWRSCPIRASAARHTSRRRSGLRGGRRSTRPSGTPPSPRPRPPPPTPTSSHTHRCRTATPSGQPISSLPPAPAEDSNSGGEKRRKSRLPAFYKTWGAFLRIARVHWVRSGRRRRSDRSATSAEGKGLESFNCRANCFLRLARVRGSCTV
jgi:hypothetical protein